jgi:uncharacterized membrane protein YhaH (DUF805 family)
MKVGRLLSPRGRIGRLHYLELSLLLIIGLFAVFAAVAILMMASHKAFAQLLCGVGYTLGIVFIIFCIYLGFILELKRLHDINMSGWCFLWIVFSGICEKVLDDGHAWMCSLPVVWKYAVTALLAIGALVGFVLNIMLFLCRGTKGSNRFGERASTFRELFHKSI